MLIMDVGTTLCEIRGDNHLAGLVFWWSGMVVSGRQALSYEKKVFLCEVTERQLSW